MATILVCDDYQPLLDLHRHCLRREGHEVHTAIDGVEGYHLFLDLQPDLLLTDWHMPRMNGLDLVLALRRHGYNAPVILLSGGSTYIHGYLDNVLLLRKPAEARRIVRLVDVLTRPPGIAEPEPRYQLGDV